MRAVAIIVMLAVLAPLARAQPAGSAEDDELEPPRADDFEGPFTPCCTGAPSIGAVLAAAYASAGLDRDPSRSWIRRARLAGLVPWLTVRTGRDTSWQDNDPDVDHGLALEVRATWRLDRLVFDSRELQVASIDAARRRERRRLASRVIRAYFTWRRAAGHASDPAAAVRADEAAAELDALTDGAFSEALAGASSENRTTVRNDRRDAR
ncbi:MAG TPA: hypothetical protein VFQ53_14335 [Kofleriaceae bacterium]|nr:hypothetical protein [Kofleriaceae bacterium]